MMNGKSKIKFPALVLTATLLAVLFGIQVIVEIFFQKSRHNEAARHTAIAHAAPVAAHASQRHWRRMWTCPTGASLTDVPAAWSNGWIAATEKGRVVALNNRGQLLWSHTFSNASFAGSPVVAGTHGIVLDNDGNVTALQVATGDVLWQVKVEGAFRHGPLVVRHGDTEDVVLLSSADGVLQDLDVRDGHARWQSEPTNRSDGSPGSDGQILAYGNCDSAVHIFSLTDGGQVATIPVGADAQMAGGVLVQDGRIYSGTRSGSLVCVDVKSNDVIWQVQVADGEAFGTPVAEQDRVIMGSRNGNLSAFAARDGALQWQVALSNEVKSLCVVDDAVFTVAGGNVVGLRTKDGREFMRLPVGDDVAGPVWNGSILVVAADGGNVIGVMGE